MNDSAKAVSSLSTIEDTEFDPINQSKQLNQNYS